MHRIFPVTLAASLLILSGVLTGHLRAQVAIRGTVTDCSSGKRLPGTNILIEATSLGTVADAKGEFILSSESGTRIRLRLSFVGFQELEHTVSVKHAGDTVRVSLCLSP